MGSLKRKSNYSWYFKENREYKGYRKYHNQEIKEILSNKGIIRYLDGSKLGNQHTEIGLYLLDGLKGNSEIRTERYSWYLRLN
jgi:hypothetical protein